MGYIEEMANKIVESHSFDIKYIEDAVNIVATVDSGGNNKWIKYDKTCFYVYSHNLLNDEYSKLWELVSQKWKTQSNEIIKERKERLVLTAYLLRRGELNKYAILKAESPDFILQNYIAQIGIEVTELTVSETKILDRIVEDNLNKDLDLNNIRNNAIKKHGKKAERYRFHKIGGVLGVESGAYSCDERKEKYSELIVRKYYKYKEQIEDFDKFIVLCNATAFEVTEENDVDDIMKSVITHKFENKFEVAILYSTEINETKLKVFEINSNTNIDNIVRKLVL